MSDFFFVGAEDLISGLHAFMASTLLAELSPQPRLFPILSLFYDSVYEHPGECSCEFTKNVY